MDLKAPTFRETVGMGIGTASMCWSPRPTGVFEAVRANEVCEAVLKELPYKYLEIRDTNTCVPVYAFRIEPLSMIRAIGYGDATFIALMTFTGEECATSPGVWSQDWYVKVHQAVIDSWDTLKSGDVLDMRVVRGETVESVYGKEN